LRASARIESVQVAAPTCSTTTSTPRPYCDAVLAVIGDPQATLDADSPVVDPVAKLLPQS
jgi:hypothetical protein